MIDESARTYAYLNVVPPSGEKDIFLTSISGFKKLSLTVKGIRTFLNGNKDILSVVTSFLIEKNKEKRMFIREFATFSPCMQCTKSQFNDFFDLSLNYAARVRLLFSEEGRRQLARHKQPASILLGASSSSSSFSSASSSSFSSSSSLSFISSFSSSTSSSTSYSSYFTSSTTSYSSPVSPSYWTYIRYTPLNLVTSFRFFLILAINANQPASLPACQSSARAS